MPRVEVRPSGRQTQVRLGRTRTVSRRVAAPGASPIQQKARPFAGRALVWCGRCQDAPPRRIRRCGASEPSAEWDPRAAHHRRIRAGPTVCTSEAARLHRTEHGRIEPRYDARLIEGPRDGVRVTVASLPQGGPVEVLSVHEDDLGVYLLAGYPDLGGSLPYRWVTWAEAAGLRTWLRFGRARRQAPPVGSHQGRPLG
jgi:hypothetical protein